MWSVVETEGGEYGLIWTDSDGIGRIEYLAKSLHAARQFIAMTEIYNLVKGGQFVVPQPKQKQAAAKSRSKNAGR